MLFLGGGAEPFHFGRGVRLGFDHEAGAFKFAAEPVFEHHAGIAAAGFFQRPTGCEIAAIRRGLQGGGAGDFAVDFQAHGVHRGVEFRAQFDLGSGDGGKVATEFQFAGGPAGVGGKFEADPRFD